MQKSAELAEPPGYHGVRDWGDHLSPVLQQSVITALQREAARTTHLGARRSSIYPCPAGG
jgi:hypothetical protein